MKRLLVTVLCLVSISTAFAFQPRTGHWWNPAESGRGFNIDIQEGVLVLTAYGYQTGGAAQWYIASGPMTNSGHNFSGTLDKYQGGQCNSCSYVGRPTLVGNDGVITVVFASETAAAITFPGGRTTTIQPFNFAIGDPPQALLGEWIFVYDIIVGGSTFAERYNFTVVGGATTNGNGIVLDTTRFATCELQIGGPLPGYVFCADWTNSRFDTVANIYQFRYGLDETYDGSWVSPITSNMYKMKGFKIASKSGTTRAASVSELAVAVKQESAASKLLQEQMSGASLMKVTNTHSAQLIEETRRVLRAQY